MRLFSVLPLSAALLLGACASDENDDHLEGYEDVILEGDVTDEALVAFAQALEAGAPVASSSKAPMLHEPADGADQPGGTIPTFSWHAGESARAARPAPASSQPAHGTPYSGYATYLEFSAGSASPLVQVFTSESEYTPSQAAWDELVAAGSSITVSLVGADFESNRLAQEGGPYAGSTTQFGITP